MGIPRYVKFETLNKAIFEKYEYSTLRIDEDVGTYYRQSTPQQIVNHSRSNQIFHLPKHLEQCGWREDQIKVIDNDAGKSAYSGKPRDGFSTVMKMIERSEIGTIASTAVDRLLRGQNPYREASDFAMLCAKYDVHVYVPPALFNFKNRDDETLFINIVKSASDFNRLHLGKMQMIRHQIRLNGGYVGQSLSVGYMIPARKPLQSLMYSNIRGLVICDPYARIVRDYAEIALKFGGSLKKSHEKITELDLALPDYSTVQSQFTPEFNVLASPRFKGGIPSTTTLKRMLTNAIYAGHSVYKNVVVEFNSHQPILDAEVFERLLNYFSDTNLDGTPNIQYRPVDRYIRRQPKRQPEFDPLCIGLLFTKIDSGEELQVLRRLNPRYNQYDYACIRNGQEMWRKRSKYIDEPVVETLKQRILMTMKPDSWSQAVSQSNIAHEKRLEDINYRLNQLVEKRRRIVVNMSNIELNPNDNFFDTIQDELQKLSKTEGMLLQQKAQIQSIQTTFIESLSHTDSEALRASLDGIPMMGYRVILHELVHRIYTEPLPNNALRLGIIWRDQSCIYLDIPQQGINYICWFKQEEELLQELLISKASQIEIASSFPFKKWRSIQNKIYTLSKKSFKFSPRPIGDHETFSEYQQRSVKSQQPVKARQGEAWMNQDMSLVSKLVEEGATKLELCQSFPHRTWDSIRKRVTIIFGKDKKIRGKLPFGRYMCYNEYRDSTNQSASV